MSGRDVNSKKRRKRLMRDYRALVAAVNAYLLAQNSEGFDQKPRAAAARVELCHAVYKLNSRPGCPSWKETA